MIYMLSSNTDLAMTFLYFVIQSTYPISNFKSKLKTMKFVTQCMYAHYYYFLNDPVTLGFIIWHFRKVKMYAEAKAPLLWCRAQFYMNLKPHLSLPVCVNTQQIKHFIKLCLHLQVARHWSDRTVNLDNNRMRNSKPESRNKISFILYSLQDTNENIKSGLIRHVHFYGLYKLVNWL